MGVEQTVQASSVRIISDTPDVYWKHCTADIIVLIDTSLHRMGVKHMEKFGLPKTNFLHNIGGSVDANKQIIE